MFNQIFITMNKRQRKIFQKLQTKVKAFGYSRKELESAALSIDGNLKLEDDASEEDIDAAIDEAIEAAIPFLKLGQSSAQRAIQQSRQNNRRHRDDDDDDDDDDEDDDDDDDNDDDDDAGSRRNNKKNSAKTNKKNRKEDAFMKQIREMGNTITELKKSIDGLNGDRKKESRKERLLEVVKDTGTFGKSVMKQFNLMTFEDDDAFEDYLDSVKDDLEELNQERANAGLGKLGLASVNAHEKPSNKDKVEALSDDEIVDLAGGKKTK